MISLQRTKAWCKSCQAITDSRWRMWGKSLFWYSVCWISSGLMGVLLFPTYCLVFLLMSSLPRRKSSIPNKAHSFCTKATACEHSFVGAVQHDVTWIDFPFFCWVASAKVYREWCSYTAPSCGEWQYWHYHLMRPLLPWPAGVWWIIP